MTEPKVHARISPDTCMIGDRIELTIEVEQDQMQAVFFPEFKRAEELEQGDDGMEMLHSYPVDTISKDGRKIVLRKRYDFTTFKEGGYDMGQVRVLFADKNVTDTLLSEESLSFICRTFQIDSTSHPIFDLKPQKNLPFKFGEITGYIKYALILLLVIALLTYGVSKWLEKRGKRLSDIFRPAPPVPPFERAFRDLEKLSTRRLWQNGEYKLYYSELTDILRSYLSGQFKIGAMEMTTDEIRRAMKTLDIDHKCKNDALEVLADADLVKFAKHEPEAIQNEDDFTSVYNFVETTRPRTEEELAAEQAEKDE